MPWTAGFAAILKVEAGPPWRVAVERDSGADHRGVSDALRLAVRELLGIRPGPSPADELYLRLSADPGPVLDELRLVADQLGDARAVLAEARQYQIRPGLEDVTCNLCGERYGALVYNLPKAGFCDRLVCDDDASCDARAERAWVVLTAVDEAKAVVARAAVAKDALRRWHAEQMEHRGQETEQPVMADPWSGTLRHYGSRAHLLHHTGSHRMLGNGDRPSHLIGAR